MKHKIKTILKYLFNGIALGCTTFVFILLGFYLFGTKEEFMLITDNFAMQTLGAVLVGIACGPTAIVYKSERLPFKMQVLIHFTVGVGTYYPTAVYLGWIPFYPNIWSNIFSVVLACCIFMATWFVFYLYNRHEANKINKRLSEMGNDYSENK